jgi:hypothetical protein
MDIYEIYYINKYKPKYNKDNMNDTEFSLTLPELNFKIYEPVNIHSKMRTILFSHTVGFTGNNTKDCLLCLYEEVNFINDLKISNCYLYELIKNCKADFVKLFLDLYMIYEETDNEILLNKKKCMFFRCKKDIISLFTKIGVFDLRDNYYVFQKDILSYKYLDRLQENSAKILEQQNVDLNEVEYNSMETFIDKPFKSLQEFKEYKNNLND